MRGLAFKKLRSDYEGGVSRQTTNDRHDLVPRESACQGESKDPLVQESVGESEISEIQNEKCRGVSVCGLTRNRYCATGRGLKTLRINCEIRFCVIANR